MKSLLFLLLLASQMQAQLKTNLITFNVKVGEDKLFQAVPKSMREEYIEEEENKSYTLEFNTTQSVFLYEGGISPKGANRQPESFFREKDSLYTLKSLADSDFEEAILIKERNANWELHNESKMIGDYKCYKATCFYIADNALKSKFTIIAWYAPSIPYPFGPKGYGGLPGMILELQDRIVLYGATKINLQTLINAKKSILKKPEGKRITSEKYSERINEIYSEKP